MALLLTDVTDILKYEYLPGMQKTLVKNGTVTGQIEKRGQKETNVPYNFTKSFQIGLSEGGGMMAYDGVLPTAGQAKYAIFTGQCKHYAHTIKLYKGVIQLMNSDKKAFIDAISGETQSAAEAIKLNLERMNFGDGGTTQLATVSAATNTSGDIVRCTVDDARFFRPGMMIDCLETNHSEIANGTDIPVDSVDVDNNYVYLDTGLADGNLSTFTSAVADAILYAANGYGAEFDGFGIIAKSLTATVLGVNRSTAANAWARPHVYRRKSSGAGIEIGAETGTAQDWEIKDLRNPVSKLMTTWGAEKSGLLAFATEDMLDYYANLWAAEGGYHQQMAKVDGWPYDSYAISGVPILSANFAPANGIFVIYMPDVVTFENQPLEWEDMDGNMWKWVANYDAYTAYMTLRKQMGHYSPYKCAYLGDIKNAND